MLFLFYDTLKEITCTYKRFLFREKWSKNSELPPGTRKDRDASQLIRYGEARIISVVFSSQVLSCHD